MASESSIAAGTRITGRIQSDGDLEVFGHVEGSIVAAGSLTVGEDATLKCDLEASAVDISGAVAGDVKAEQSIVLQPGARVQGDLSAPSVGIRPGALVRGHVNAGGSRTATPPRTAPKQTSRAAPAAPREQPASSKPVEDARGGPSRADATKKAPAPVMPKAARQAKKRTTTKRASAAAAPEPVVPALKKRSRTTKTKRRRAR
jgi:cytoskeletal protein CcmA (bactofilin family)